MSSSLIIVSILQLVVVTNLFQGSSASQEADQADHFCAKLAQGRFDAIRIQSFTYLGARKLVFFANNYKYEIPMDTLTESSLEVPEQLDRWNTGELVDADKRLQPDEEWIQSITVLSKSIRKRFRRVELNVISLVTNRRVYWMDVSGDDHFVVDEVRSYRNNHPDYSIMTYQGKEGFLGYVINQDNYGYTKNFVIYKLAPNFDTRKLNVHIPNATISEEAAAEFYYMQQDDDPNMLNLVSRSYYKNSVNKRQKVFGKLPRGFLFTNRLYLFGQDCVTVIEDFKFPGFLEENIYLKQKNIPFERFFKCPGAFKFDKFPSSKYKANRCYPQPVNRVHNQADALALRSAEHGKAEPEEPEEDKRIKLMIGIGVFVVIMAALIGCFFWGLRKCKSMSTSTSTNKVKKNNKKRKNKSTSPTSSKSSLSLKNQMG